MIPYYKVKEGSELPLCQHGDVPTTRVSGSEKNPFRPYLACRRKNSCRYFQWADEEPYNVSHRSGQHYEPKLKNKITQAAKTERYGRKRHR